MRIEREENRGLVAWMVRNRVTPNLIMIFLIIGGLYSAKIIQKEVFPAFEIDAVTISVGYSGASPEEVEQGIVLVVEEAIQSVEGIDEIVSTASEGSGEVKAELREGVDTQKVLQEIKQEIDRITTFPDEADEPVVEINSHKRSVLQLSFYGDVSDLVLREISEQVRDRLLQQSEISQITIVGARDYEIQVEVSQNRLRTYGLSLADVAQRIKQLTVELPGGEIETRGGEILLRVKERRDWASEFSRLPIITGEDGTVVYLGDIASVKEGLEDTDELVTFNGQPSIALDVYRVGAETPLGVAQSVKNAMAEIEADLPPGVHWEISRDRSKTYTQRLHMLLKNAAIGLVLVLVLLGLFLEIRLAFWVTMGIPVSFLGCMLLLPGLDVSINMISMFAFIVALGIVVDDAIIVGENIYSFRQETTDYVTAAVRGTRDIAVPIALSILTNIAAFLPLLFIPGPIGRIWRVIPIVVVTAFLISWIESLWILPTHLAHSQRGDQHSFLAPLHRLQQVFSRGLDFFIQRLYGPALHRILYYRYLVIGAAALVMLFLLAFVQSGRIGMILQPRIESDYSVVTATLPYGSAEQKAVAVRDTLVAGLKRTLAKSGKEVWVTDIFTQIEANSVEVTAFLADEEHRPVSTQELTRMWRENTDEILGLESLVFEFDRGGPGRGKSLPVELAHRDSEVLNRASEALAQRLIEFPQVKDVDDGVNLGKEQLDFRITPEGESLGLTASEIATQVRNSFRGVTALKQQRGRNEVEVIVRLPEGERMSEYAIETMLIKTPGGTFVPLSHVAQLSRGRAYSVIDRRDGRRAVTVGVNVVPIGKTGLVREALNRTILPELVQQFPGLSYSYQGRQANMRKSLSSLKVGFAAAMLIIYFLLAIPFASYVQPLIVMTAIPFGIIGAIIGHLVMGYDLSLMSMMGIVALSGVLVNDSLVLIDYANKEQARGLGCYEAIFNAGLRRFRPILLTTLTTFGGLAPMIFETSRQARFMIPMALSLGYGILFSTLIVLVLIPCLVLVTEDLHRLKQQLGQAVCSVVRPADR